MSTPDKADGKLSSLGPSRIAHLLPEEAKGAMTDWLSFFSTPFGPVRLGWSNGSCAGESQRGHCVMHWSFAAPALVALHKLYACLEHLPSCRGRPRV